eukprot:scaffold5540_cov390-Prasinococcus_capsulatus_cf.AAC.5
MRLLKASVDEFYCWDSLTNCEMIVLTQQGPQRRFAVKECVEADGTVHSSMRRKDPSEMSLPRHIRSWESRPILPQEIPPGEG